MRSTWLIVLLGFVLGCGPSAPPRSGDSPEPSYAKPDKDDGKPKGATERDAPEISRSVGIEGGVIVFWPRVIPRSEDPEIMQIAKDVQAALSEVTSKAGAGSGVDVRPEPERVCPQSGCAAMTLGAILVHRSGGCTVLGLVSEPGKSDIRIVPWAGIVRLKKDVVGFREPPESQVTVKDAAACKDVVKQLAKRDKDLVDKVKAALGK